MTNGSNLSDRKDKLSSARRALLAKRLQGAKGSGQASNVIEKRPLSGPAPLSYTQQRIWFMHQLTPDGTAYNMHDAWRVRGPLDLPALDKALNQVGQRQPALRTTFIVVDDQPWQQVADTRVLPLPIFDLSHLSQD